MRVRPVLITVVVLGVLFVAADRIAVKVVESKAASRLQSSQDLSVKPDVSIKGFPFLTQVAGGTLDDVKASGEGITAGNGQTTLHITRFSANLHDVQLSNGYSTAVAKSASGSALISYQDLSDAAPDGVKVSYGGRNPQTGAGQVKVSGHVSLLGKSWDRSVVSEVTLKNGDTLGLHALSIPDIGGLPELEDLVRQQIDFSQQVHGLPSGIKLKKVTVDPKGMSIELAGTDVSLTS